RSSEPVIGATRQLKLDALDSKYTNTTQKGLALLYTVGAIDTPPDAVNEAQDTPISPYAVHKMRAAPITRTEHTPTPTVPALTSTDTILAARLAPPPATPDPTPRADERLKKASGIPAQLTLGRGDTTLLGTPTPTAQAQANPGVIPAAAPTPPLATPNPVLRADGPPRRAGKLPALLTPNGGDAAPPKTPTPTNPSGAPVAKPTPPPDALDPGPQANQPPRRTRAGLDQYVG
ncbi:MAG: hypothetical protein LBD43_01010, partial [Holosporales bacterium]|nr:hypothetical protein [Holosporales bacterium]